MQLPLRTRTAELYPRHTPVMRWVLACYSRDSSSTALRWAWLGGRQRIPPVPSLPDLFDPCTASTAAGLPRRPAVSDLHPAGAVCGRTLHASRDGRRGRTGLPDLKTNPPRSTRADRRRPNTTDRVQLGSPGRQRALGGPGAGQDGGSVIIQTERSYRQSQSSEPLRGAPGLLW